ncbi:MAG: GNAT family N-acetyltransferase [Lachnospiraceae bacterium]
MIRPAKREDLPALLEIYNDAVRTTTATFDLVERTLAEHRIWFEQHLFPYCIFVLEEEGEIAGYGSLSEYRSRKGFACSSEISVYVHTAHRRKQVGRRLVDACLAYARETNRFHSLLALITGDNTGSIRLHEAAGFTCCGILREVGRKFDRYLDLAVYQLLL